MAWCSGSAPRDSSGIRAVSELEPKVASGSYVAPKATFASALDAAELIRDT